MSLRDFYAQVSDSIETLESYAAQAVKIHSDDVSPDMRTHAEQCRFWSQLAVIAMDEAIGLKDHVREVVLEDCKERARQELKAADEKAPESRVEGRAKRDPAYQRAQASLRAAETRAGLIKATEQALLQRTFMLQSLNSRQCRELSQLPDRS
jgi:hypothetical protein